MWCSTGLVDILVRYALPSEDGNKVELWIIIHRQLKNAAGDPPPFSIVLHYRNQRRRGCIRSGPAGRIPSRPYFYSRRRNIGINVPASRVFKSWAGSTQGIHTNRMSSLCSRLSFSPFFFPFDWLFLIESLSAPLFFLFLHMYIYSHV